MHPFERWPERHRGRWLLALEGRRRLSVGISPSAIIDMLDTIRAVPISQATPVQRSRSIVSTRLTFASASR